MASDWIEQYTKWATKRSPLTPKHFHQNIALTLVAGAIAGRCFVQMAHRPIYPNLYTVIIGRTSVYAKTTALDLAMTLADNVMPEKVFSHTSTPEALLLDLAGQNPSNYDEMTDEEKKSIRVSKEWGARRLFMLDEAGMFFNSLQKEYNSGMSDLFMHLYDAGSKPIKHNTRGSGMVTVKNYAMSVLFATTPYAIRLLLSKSDFWMSGFWNRWNFVGAKEMTDWKDGEFCAMPSGIAKSLKKISDGWLNTKNTAAYSIPIADNQIIKEYNEAQKSSRLREGEEKFDGLMAHLPTKHLKAAIIYAVMDGEGYSPRLRLKHWEQAGELVNGWYEDTQTILESLRVSERYTDEEKIVVFIRSFVRGITTRGIQQRFGISASELMKVLEPLERMGVIKKSPEGRTFLWSIRKEGDKEGEAPTFKFPE